MAQPDDLTAVSLFAGVGGLLDGIELDMPKGVYPHKHIKPKVYNPVVVTLVEQMYYVQEMSQVEIAAALGLTQKVVWKLMLNHGMRTRPQVKRNQSASSNDSWRGDDAGYHALHIRVGVARGKPKRCSICDRSDPTTRYEWANLTGNYKDVRDYARMCVPCHRRFDAKRRNETGERTSPPKGVKPNAR